MTIGFHQRIAVYFCPPADSRWAQLGADWLGWDPERGVATRPPHPDWVQRAQRYGFHATLKAPFRLRDPGSMPDFLHDLEKLARYHRRFELRLQLQNIEQFWAFSLTEPNPALNLLEQSLVVDLDDYRAELNAQEMQKRLQHPLTERQHELLQRWGYPFVLDQFRFHMTLTRADPEGAAQAPLMEHFAEILDTPLPIDQLAVMGEREDGHFELITRVELG